MDEYQFGRVTVYVWPELRHVSTRFADGTRTEACPETNDAYVERAAGLGYEGDDATWEMCRDHELLHSYLAWLYTGEPSRALWAVAHHENLNRQDIGHEERTVLRLQATHRQWGFEGFARATVEP